MMKWILALVLCAFAIPAQAGMFGNSVVAVRSGVFHRQAVVVQPQVQRVVVQPQVQHVQQVQRVVVQRQVVGHHVQQVVQPVVVQRQRVFVQQQYIPRSQAVIVRY